MTEISHGEVDQRLEDAVAPPSFCQAAASAGAIGDADLALAVIALACRSSRMPGSAGRPAAMSASLVDRLIVGGADAELAEERLLAQPVLGEVDRLHAGPHRLVAPACRRRLASGTFSNS
mgnify:CR=1 FL=1